eukprot:102892-Pleurochrysis_carterae.AAC.1
MTETEPTCTSIASTRRIGSISTAISSAASATPLHECLAPTQRNRRFACTACASAASASAAEWHPTEYKGLCARRVMLASLRAKRGEGTGGKNREKPEAGSIGGMHGFG